MSQKAEKNIFFFSDSRVKTYLNMKSTIKDNKHTRGTC